MLTADQNIRKRSLYKSCLFQHCATIYSKVITIIFNMKAYPRPLKFATSIPKLQCSGVLKFLVQNSICSALIVSVSDKMICKFVMDCLEVTTNLLNEPQETNVAMAGYGAKDSDSKLETSGHS